METPLNNLIENVFRRVLFKHFKSILLSMCQIDSHCNIHESGLLECWLSNTSKNV